MAKREIRFEQIHEEGYEELVASTFRSEFVPNAANPVDIYVGGPCPRCEHATAFRYTIMIIKGIDQVDEAMAEGLWRTAQEQGHEMPSEWSFTAYCHCDVPHPNAGENVRGCGGYWGMTVARERKEAK